jgi:FkbH-like protein
MLGKFTDYSDYLSSLQMVADVGRLDALNLSRMAQLINKSNQFNLTGNRYSESELLALSLRDDCEVRYYRLADRFGDNGLISVVVLLLRPGGLAEIDVWVMSCRVLSRTMEEFIGNDIAAVAQARGCDVLLGRYRPTAKNKLVAALYERLGFTAAGQDGEDSLWRQMLQDRRTSLKSFIRVKEIVDA